MEAFNLLAHATRLTRLLVMRATYGFFCLGLIAMVLNCSTSSGQRYQKPDVPNMESELSLKREQEMLAPLRKDIPEEKKAINDRLREIINQWSELKSPPERLREKFQDEIRRTRAENDRKFTRAREDFRRFQEEKRKKFYDSQKKDREDFLSSKPKSDERSEFTRRASEDRERFQGDARAERDEFEAQMKDQRKILEDYFKERQDEFRLEYPEYVRRWKERDLQVQEERKQEILKRKVGNGPQGADVNKGKDGWPSTDPSELQELSK